MQPPTEIQLIMKTGYSMQELLQEKRLFNLFSKILADLNYTIVKHVHFFSKFDMSDSAYSLKMKFLTQLVVDMQLYQA